jgi:GTP cyclohydrolase IA
MSDKTDAALGERVRQHLIKVGLETPMNYEQVQTKNERKIKNISKHFTAIMSELGLDLTDDSLIDTPNRVAKMYVREIFYGLDYNNFPKCTRIENKMGQTDSFVLERNINVQSNCEHHFVVIDGKATVAYIPKDTILGLSKLNRIVQFFAKRPQVQERLTEQIAETISFITGSPDVAVYIEGVHYCVKSRGIQDVTSSTMTLATRGGFSTLHSDLRREFLNSARMMKLNQ